MAFTGSVLSIIALQLADHCPARFLPNLEALTELLDGDGWQTVRGLALLAAGGALTVAWGLGNLTLGLILVAPRWLSGSRTLTSGAYRACVLGVLLLAVGTLIGGLPNWGLVEAWALTALLGYGLLLHARFAGWLGDLGLALGCTLGFAILALASCATGLLAEGGLQRTGVYFLAWLLCAVAANTGLAIHALHRFWFSCPRPTYT
jgi:hypothetical protein